MTDYGDLAYSLAGVRRQNPFDRRRQMAYGFMQQGLDATPVQHPLQGAGRMAQALLGAWMSNRVDTDEQAAVERQNASVMEAMKETDPQKQIAMLGKSNPELAARMAGQLAVEKSKVQTQLAGLQGGAGNLYTAYGVQPPAGGPQTAVGDRIANVIESGGRYDAVGPVANAQGHRAWGKYQVLEPNVGPWTQEVTGRPWTPQEFIADTPEAKAVQEAVFKAKFGQYVQKYGSQEAASRAWFAGEGGMNNPNARDVNGMTVARYQQLATGNPMVAQGNNPQVAPGMPPAPSPQGIAAPTVVAPPAAPQYPQMQRQAPPPELIAKHTQIMRAGGYGLNPYEAEAKARAAIEAENDKLNADRHEAAKAAYDQQYGDYKFQREQGAKAPQERFTNAGKVRDDYLKDKSVQAYREVVPILESVKEAVNRPSRAADLNLIYGLGKIMDPNSVVREGEMVMARGTGTVQDYINGLLGQLNGSPTLTPETRQKLVAEMVSRFKGLEASHNTITDAYRGLAERNGLNPDDVIIPIRKQAAQGEAARPQGPVKLGANGEGYDQLPVGAQYIAPDGSLRTKGGK